MKISDSFVLLQSRNYHQATKAHWQTLSDSGSSGNVDLLKTGPLFVDFLTGQLDITSEQQLSISSGSPVNFASDESMRLMREITGHRESFSLFADLLRINPAHSFSSPIKQTSQRFMSNYHFLSRPGNGLFVGSQTWGGRYRVNFQHHQVMQGTGALFAAGRFATESSGGQQQMSPLLQTVRQDSWHLHQEKQQLYFAARGVVTTEDGQNIVFNLDQTYNQSVSVLSGETTYLTQRPLIDPLVLDLDGQGVGFSNETIDFDLDGDGVLDRFSCLDDGCGFLAYDSNGDGCVTNGLELFGIASGSGFAELAAYDEDGNDWIDENDAIYNDLSIWSTADDGTSLLQSLQDADVGAICLVNADSSFGIVGDDGELQGQISSSGVYLTESGRVETLHQIDIAVLDKDKEALSPEREETVPEGSDESGVKVA